MVLTASQVALIMRDARVALQTDNEASTDIHTGRYGSLIIKDTYVTNQQALIDLQPQRDVCIGRSPACDYVCTDPTVSTEHVRIRIIVFGEYGDDPSKYVAPLVYADDLSRNGTSVERSLESQDVQDALPSQRINGSALLREGDRLVLSSHVSAMYVLYEPNNQVAPPRTRSSSLASEHGSELEQIRDLYRVSSQCLGIGGHGSVYAAVHRKSGRPVACKIVSLSLCTFHFAEDESPQSQITRDDLERRQQQRRQETMAKLVREYKVLKDLDHPNIIRLEKVFQSPNNIYIFQELCVAGDLYSYIEAQHGGLGETKAAVISLQLLKGVECLHSHQITHRDIKPDNILLADSSSTPRIVLTDFGHARMLPGAQAAHSDVPWRRQRMTSYVGTYEYSAPEIHHRNPVQKIAGYSKAIDMWSIGTIVFLLLSGDSPFADVRDPLFLEDPFESIMQRAGTCDLSVLDRSTKWLTIGQRSKDFIRELLVLDENKRLDVKQALNHAWFTHPQYAKEFEAIYHHSIRDWKPRRKLFNLIEKLQTSRSSKPPVKSQFFSHPASTLQDEASTQSQHHSAPLSPIHEEDFDLNIPPPSHMPTQSDGVIDHMSQLMLEESQQGSLMMNGHTREPSEHESYNIGESLCRNVESPQYSHDVVMTESGQERVQETQLSQEEWYQVGSKPGNMSSYLERKRKGLSRGDDAHAGGGQTQDVPWAKKTRVN